MKTLFNINNRNFTSLEFAKKYANEKNLDYSLISERQIKRFKIIKRNYGVEFNNSKASNSYATKEDAINAGNSWLRDCTIHSEIRKGWNFEVKEV